MKKLRTAMCMASTGITTELKGQAGRLRPS